MKNKVTVELDNEASAEWFARVLTSLITPGPSTLSLAELQSVLPHVVSVKTDDKPA